MVEAEHMPSEERLRALLFGKRILNVEVRDEEPEPNEAGPTGYLTLDDGTVLKLWGNDGGCSCSAGDYPLTTLNAVDNAITNVVIAERRAGDDVPCRVCGKEGCYTHDEEEGYYRIFVVAEDQRHLLASFEGSDGNGYYGTGWWLKVTTAENVRTHTAAL